MMEISNTSIAIVGLLITFIGINIPIILYILSNIRKTQSTLFKRIDENRELTRNLIDDNRKQDIKDREYLEDKIVKTMEKSYVPLVELATLKGALNTLEQKLSGEIHTLAFSIDSLVKTLNKKESDD